MFTDPRTHARTDAGSTGNYKLTLCALGSGELKMSYVLIEMLLVLFKIAAKIHFIYHIQVQTSGLHLS